MCPANNVLFSSDLWLRALDRYASNTHLTVKLFGVDERVVLGPVNPTPLFQLFEEKGYDSGIFAECARRCLAQGDSRPAVMVCETYGLAAVGTSLVLDGKIVGAAVGGYALVDFSQQSEVQRLAKDAGLPFEQLWQVAREQQPVPQRRLMLNGELLQVLGDALLRENYRTRRYEETVLQLEEAGRATDQAHQKLQETASALRESEGHYRLLFDLGPAAVYSCDASGVIQEFNRRAAELWGRTPVAGDTDERFCGSFKLFRPDGSFMPHDQCPMAQVVSGKISETRDVEVLIERPDGSRITVIVNIRPLKNEHGEVIGAVNCFYEITERKENEQALQESERRFREMIDALPAAVYTTNAEGDLTHFNPAAIELSGRIPELGTDKWCVSWKMFRPDGTRLPHDECPMAIALKEGRIIRGAEAILERPDGKRIWFEPYPTPLHDAEGKVVGGINMLVDITERKHAEQALRRSESNLRDFIENASVGLHWVGPDGVILWANQTELDLLGYTREEYVGHHVSEFHADQPAIDDILRRLLRGETLHEYEARLRHKDGSIRYVLISSNALFEDDKFIHTRCFTRDITERKQAVEALRESEEQFRSIFEQTTGGIAQTDLTGRFTVVNDRYCEIVGRSRAELMDLRMQDITHPEDLRTNLEQFIALAEGRGPNFVVEKRYIRPDGSHVWVQNQVSAIQDANGAARSLAAAVTDVTARKQAEAALRESENRFRTLADALDVEVRHRTDELEQRNADVVRQSDELRELSARLMQIQDGERRHIARELHDSAGQIVTALGMSLANAAAHAGQDPQLAKTLQDSQELLQQLNKEIRTTSYLLHPPLLDENGLPGALRWFVDGLIQRSGLDIQLSIPEDFERLPDEMELVVFRIVQECLTNIHRHSGSKNAAIRIEAADNSINLEVQDRGKGIPAEKLPQLQSQGSGVGIRGMRERVRQLGGQMSIESNARGTKIAFRFPFQQKFPSADQETVSQLRAVS